ncbi:MAG: DNA-protecting protein DprA [Candidatus Liptonbacteria bacterium]|nr:DNA-protecting protein DprA [Candidatus Liptonbacteria bacterium]
MTEKISYHALNRAWRGSYQSLSAAREQYPTWTAAWQAYQKQRVISFDCENQWRELERKGVQLILQNESAFPRLLREIPWPPHGVYVRGKLPDPERYLAIVGTRRATPQGRETAHWFAEELARGGGTIVSGLAFGIDVAAHTGCLDGQGQAVAVLASGPDEITPRTNRAIAERILAGAGAIISEYPPDTEPLPHRFLERNRIVSGLSRGVVIIEAPERSGSLATARFALEQNRDVFVVPGPIRHPNFVGSHKLIQAGADLVTHPQEILERYGWATRSASETEQFASPEEQQIIRFLGDQIRPAGIDKIAESTKLDTRTVSEVITLLILKGKVAEAGGGYAIA